MTKLAGFEHSEYIQPNATKIPMNTTDIPMVQGKNIRGGEFVEKYDWYIKKKSLAVYLVVFLIKDVF